MPMERATVSSSVVTPNLIRSIPSHMSLIELRVGLGWSSSRGSGGRCRRRVQAQPAAIATGIGLWVALLRPRLALMQWRAKVFNCCEADMGKSRS